MSVELENRGRIWSFQRGLRSLLSRSSILRGPESNHADVQAVSVASVTPGHAMFQDARNTSIQNATFNIYGSGPNISPVSQYPESTGSPPSSSGSSLSSFGAESLPEPLMTEIDIPPSVHDPFPPPQTSPEIYVHCLKSKNRGYPLWIPSPSMSLPASYRSAGVMVGDVGIITPEGGFSFFFNVFHETTHPINSEMLLPDNFVPFVPRGPSDVVVLKESSAMSYLSDESVARMDCGAERLKTVLNTSAKQAAVLMMPEPVYYSRLQGVNLFRQYVNKYLEAWYRFVRGELGRDVENGELRVVYGCRKSAGFGIATICNGSPDPTTELTFSIDDSWTDIAGCRYRWHHRGSAEVKAGPSVDENLDLRELEPPGNAPVNQCLFLSTLDFTLSDDQWARVDSDVSVPVSAHASTTQITAAKAPTSPPLLQKGTVSSSMNTEVQSDVLSKSIRITDQMTSLKRPFHPSDVLAGFLLSIFPDAKSVAICSEDWGPFMTDDVQDASSLIYSVLCANDVCEEDGMIYLNEGKHVVDEPLEDGVLFESDYAQFEPASVMEPSQPDEYLQQSHTEQHVHHTNLLTGISNYFSSHISLPMQRQDDVASKETHAVRRICFNCHTTEPPSWRRSILNLGHVLCNKCGLYERTHLRPRPLRFDELRIGDKTRKLSIAAVAADSETIANPSNGRVRQSSRNDYCLNDIARRSSASTSTSSADADGGGSDWDYNETISLQLGLAESIPQSGSRIRNNFIDITSTEHPPSLRFSAQGPETSHTYPAAYFGALESPHFAQTSFGGQHPTPSARTLTERPWTGFIDTTRDALLILEGARRGVIPRLSRKLDNSERRMITSGSVFVYHEGESGIERWMDGIAWGPSRCIGNFLLYREKHRAGHHSTFAELMQRKATASSVAVRGLHIGNQGLNLNRPKTDNSYLGLDESEQYLDTLIKKTFSITINGVAQRVISYFTIADVESGRLRSPSSFPELAELDISPEYLDRRHFRNPPKIQIGVDGVPRYRGESDDMERDILTSVAHLKGLKVGQDVWNTAYKKLGGPILEVGRQRLIPNRQSGMSGDIGTKRSTSTLFDSKESQPKQKRLKNVHIQEDGSEKKHLNSD